MEPLLVALYTVRWGVARWERQQTHVIVARYHRPITDIIADAVFGLVGVNVVCHFFHLLCPLLLLVLAALGALDVGNGLLAILGCSYLAFGWRLPTRARTRGRWLWGYCERRYRLAKDTMTTSFADTPTLFVWLGLLALGFGCG